MRPELTWRPGIASGKVGSRLRKIAFRHLGRRPAAQEREVQSGHRVLQLKTDPYPILDTPRLVLRAVEVDDVPAMFRLRSDPRVMRFIGRPMAKTLDDAAALVTAMRASVASGQALNWAITVRGSDELVGTIGFVHLALEHHRAELGYLLDPRLWGKGVMREAGVCVIDHGFRVQGFHSLEARVEPANSASVALLLRLGFSQEGRLRESFLHDGVFHDTAIFSRLRPEQG